MKIQNQIAIYKSKTGNISLEVNFKKDSVWITQDQIALLFSTQRPAITKHLNNIFKSGELSKKQLVPFWNILLKMEKHIKQIL